MSFRSIVHLTVVFWLGLSPAALAEHPVDALLEATGGRFMLEESWPKLIERRVADVRGRAEPAVRRAIDRVLREVTAPGTTREVSREVFGRDMNESHLRRVMGFFESSLGRTIRRADAEAARPESRRAYDAFVKGLRAERPNPDRLALARRLEAASRSTDGILRMSRTFLANILKHTRERARDGGAVPSDEALARAFALAERRGQTTVRKGNIVAALFAYREVSLRDFEAFVRFAESDAGKWYDLTLWRSLVEATGRAGDAVGRAIVGALPGAPGSAPFGAEWVAAPTRPRRV